MNRTLKLPLLACLAAAALAMSGCPGRKSADEEPEEVYRVGRWLGTVVTEARLVLAVQPEPGQPWLGRYWNAAWKVEANIMLDEYQDGSLDGRADVNLFHWYEINDSILDYTQIAGGRWDKYVVFALDLQGSLDDHGYSITTGKLPLSLPDPTDRDAVIEFYDFLYPSVLQGSWPKDGTRIIGGESNQVQGDDYTETQRRPTFREFSIVYRWSMHKL